jgi:hypothetical protein
MVTRIPAGPRAEDGLTIWIEPGDAVAVAVGVSVGVAVAGEAAGSANTALVCSGPPRPKSASQTAQSSSASDAPASANRPR